MPDLFSLATSAAHEAQDRRRQMLRTAFGPTIAAALADASGAPPTLDRPVVLIGPEGGWTPDERGAGLPMVRLAANVLRAETAAITAGALLAALRAGLLAEAWRHPGAQVLAFSATVFAEVEAEAAWRR